MQDLYFGRDMPSPRTTGSMCVLIEPTVLYILSGDRPDAKRSDGTKSDDGKSIYDINH